MLLLRLILLQLTLHHRLVVVVTWTWRLVVPGLAVWWVVEVWEVVRQLLW